MKQKLYWQRSLTVTVLLMLLVAAVSFGATQRINQLEEERSFELLQQEAGNLAQEIADGCDKDREELELLAAMIAGYETLDSPKLWQVLDSYAGVGMMSRLELLLPGDTLVVQGGETRDVKGLLSFEEEAAQGAHISNREPDIEKKGSYVVRNMVPVIRTGETVALLCGVIELGSFPAELAATPYGGAAALYIIDGATGDFLVDTWHNAPGGNIWALGEREMAPGYHHEQLKQGLIDGQEGYVVFVSQSIGEWLYFYYEPIAINQWRIALSVPENVVFASAYSIRNILNIFLAAEAFCFLLYFLWMLRYVRGITNEKQRQLDTLHNIYDVERLLFNAHERQENLTQALEQVGQMLSARAVWFWAADVPAAHSFYWWCRGGAEEADQAKTNGRRMGDVLFHYFRQGNAQLEAYSPEALRKGLPNLELEACKSVLAIPVKDPEGGICGVLAGGNLTDRRLTPAILKSVEFSFSRFSQNLRSYYAIKARGERDALSGLYNRNRYEADRVRYREFYTRSLACVYLDANGLHELNNNLGHEAGDRMLQSVAQQMCAAFGSRFTYRIGGDEFLAFVPDREKKEVERIAGDLERKLAQMGYAVSLGIEWQETVETVELLVKGAEKKMYEAKAAYYRQEAHDRRRRT